MSLIGKSVRSSKCITCRVSSVSSSGLGVRLDRYYHQLMNTALTTIIPSYDGFSESIVKRIFFEANLPLRVDDVINAYIPLSFNESRGNPPIPCYSTPRTMLQVDEYAYKIERLSEDLERVLESYSIN